MSGHQQAPENCTRQRLRSRAACDRCRQSRVKCNGEQPCHRCRQRAQDCSFSRSPARVSRVDGLWDAHETTEILSTSHLPDDSPNSAPEPILTPTAPNALPVEPFVSPRSIAWPWLHEDLFLSEDINLDWFDASFATQLPLPVEPAQFFSGGAVTSGTARISSAAAEAADENNPASQTIWPGLQNVTDISRDDLVATLVDQAMENTTMEHRTLANDGDIHRPYFQALLAPIKTAFDLNEKHPSPNQNYLDTYVELYLANFWTLWPLFPKHMCRPGRFQPLLYLTLASIGAMYGGKASSLFGATLHIKLREVLAKPLFSYDKDALSLGQARSLTQAAALYFGQKQAFSYAQHIGGLLVAQARRMNLFVSGTEAAYQVSGQDQEQHLSRWIRQECRKRLAFAIMRLEMYTSVLQSTRPLLSAEEMNINMPCSRYLWYTSFESTSAYVAAIQQTLAGAEQSPLRFSDLCRIGKDPDEALPPLDSLGEELLMNSLQEQVWDACSSQTTLRRLSSICSGPETVDSGLDLSCGEQEPIIEPAPSLSAQHPESSLGSISLENQIARHRRKLASLRHRITATTSALRKWQRQSCQLTAGEAPTSLPARSSLLSCLLLYHLSFMRLHAPIDLMQSLCHLSFSLDEDCNILHSLASDMTRTEALRALQVWSQNDSASIALQHALHIFDLLQHEARRPVQDRASFNFLTMLGLYHSATLVWIYAGNHAMPEQTTESIGGVRSEPHRLARFHRILRLNSSSADGDVGNEAADGHDNQQRNDNDVQDFALDRWPSTDYDRPSTPAVVTAVDIVQPNTAKLMNAFASLFTKISPAWAPRSSFFAAVRKLATAKYPTLEVTKT